MKKWEISGFLKSFNSIEAFKKTIELGDYSDRTDVKEAVNRWYIPNFEVEILGIKEV